MTLKKSEHVGRKLKILIRKSKFITQENFADAMKVDATTVRRWISRGVKDINLIVEIADMLEIDFWELLKWGSLFFSIVQILHYFIFGINCKIYMSNNWNGALLWLMKEKTLAEKIGTNLKTLIKESKFRTQDRFASEGMNVDPVTVRRWISKGIRDINTIYEISKVLDVSIEELIKK